jgi:hypothetical protein
VLLAPVYWLMMSLAAVKAVVQLFFMPFYWEKTTHGLDSTGSQQATVAPGPAPVASGDAIP